MHMSTALQVGRNASTGLQVVSTAKHFALYNCEECTPCDFDTMGTQDYPLAPGQWAGRRCQRDHYNAIASDQDIVDYYLPSFRAIVQSKAVSSVMCSYPQINSVPAW